MIDFQNDPIEQIKIILLELATYLLIVINLYKIDIKFSPLEDYLKGSASTREGLERYYSYLCFAVGKTLETVSPKNGYTCLSIGKELTGIIHENVEMNKYWMNHGDIVRWFSSLPVVDVFNSKWKPYYTKVAYNPYIGIYNPEATFLIETAILVMQTEKLFSFYYSTNNRYKIEFDPLYNIRHYARSYYYLSFPNTIIMKSFMFIETFINSISNDFLKRYEPLLDDHQKRTLLGKKLNKDCKLIFLSLREKIENIPHVINNFINHNSTSYKIDDSTEPYKSFFAMKKFRDALTHPKPEDKTDIHTSFEDLYQKSHLAFSSCISIARIFWKNCYSDSYPEYLFELNDCLIRHMAREFIKLSEDSLYIPSSFGLNAMFLNQS